MTSRNMVVVVGVPGVGKSSICQTVAPEVGCNYINYGDLMLDIARQKNLAKTDTEMFALDMDLQYQIWKESANIISAHDDVIVDLHGLDQSPEGYLFSLPIEIICPTLIVIVEASLENIFYQRKKDYHKERIKDDFKSLKDHMQMLRIAMSISSVLLGSAVYLLNNDDLKKTRQELIDLLGKI